MVQAAENAPLFPLQRINWQRLRVSQLAISCPLRDAFSVLEFGGTTFKLAKLITTVVANHISCVRNFRLHPTRLFCRVTRTLFQLTVSSSDPASPVGGIIHSLCGIAKWIGYLIALPHSLNYAIQPNPYRLRTKPCCCCELSK